MSTSSPAMHARFAPDRALDDAALVRTAQAGKHDAILLVWDRYASLVRGVLRRSLGPQGDVEDLVQEVFIGFHRNVGNLRDPSALSGFLVSIASRLAISEIRKRKVRSFLRLTDDGELPERAAVSDDGPEALGRLYALLDTCSATDRMAFVLRYIEGLELEEVASALGVSLATAKRRIAGVNARIVTLAKKDPLLSAYVIEEPVPS